MFTLSAFADEISPEPEEQIRILQASGVNHIEFRSIDRVNVLALSDTRIAEFKRLLDDNGFSLSAIGSPIGKIRIDEPFEPHLEKFQRAMRLCEIFDVPNIRIFSYYPPEKFDGDWSPYRNEVINRMRDLAGLAEKHSLMLFHENEHRIYGDSPERVADIFESVGSPNLKAVYDPANFVFCGYDPLAGWHATKPYLAHFHIKDWVRGATHGAMPGQGDGKIPTIIAEAVADGYTGYATLEPHLLGGGPTGGVTGPDLFPQAIDAFRAILDAAGAKYQ